MVKASLQGKIVLLRDGIYEHVHKSSKFERSVPCTEKQVDHFKSMRSDNLSQEGLDLPHIWVH